MVVWVAAGAQLSVMWGRGDALACGRMGLLLLVRHGQASFGADDYDVLSPTGWEQGRALGADLAARGIAPSALLRGDMRRHRETFEAMLQGAAGAPGWDADRVEVDPGWDEFDHRAVVAADPGVPHGSWTAAPSRPPSSGPRPAGAPVRTTRSTTSPGRPSSAGSGVRWTVRPPGQGAGTSWSR